MSFVPCKGCVLCCRNDAVRLLPHEDASAFETEEHPAIPGARMLAHKANGDCIYLGDGGCSIHERRPQLCRDMDCRNLARSFSWLQAMALPGLAMPVWNRGKELLGSGG